MSRELYVITGASRGFGHELALLVQKGVPNADLLLLSRSPSSVSATDDGRLVVSTSLDLSVLGSVEEQLDEALKKVENRGYSKVTVVNNSGSLGPLLPTGQLGGHLDAIRAAVDLNLTSVFLINAKMLDTFAKDPEGSVREVVLVEISSGAATFPLENWSVYCSVKAARAMMTKVIAAEGSLQEKERAEKGDTPGVSVRSLSYSPGIMNTALQAEIAQSVDHPSKAFLADAIATGKAVSPADSAAELFKLLVGGSFKSGAFESLVDLRPDLK